MGPGPSQCPDLVDLIKLSGECGCPTGNPSAAVRRAASGCHYTRDHLLLLKPPGPAGVQPRTGAGSSPSYHVSYDPRCRLGVCTHPTLPTISNVTGRSSGYRPGPPFFLLGS